jgi:hypothetical protein
MEIVTYAGLRDLLEAGQGSHVTLFMPTHRQGRDTRQDPVRLKNLLRDAEERLVEAEMRPSDARDLLKPARDLVEDHEFWQHNAQGLAIFLAQDTFRVEKLPVEVEDVAFVGERFEIKPLLPLLEGRSFYVLALSIGEARVLQCTSHGCHPLAMPEDVAMSLREAIHGENTRGTLLHRTDTSYATTGTQSPGGAGEQNRPGSTHGHAEGFEIQAREDERFYFRQLAEGLKRAIGSAHAPIVIAGVETKVAAFRGEADLPDLVETIIPGNPEHVSDGELHRAAKEILEPIWHHELNGLQEQYGNAKGKGLASNVVEEIVKETATGRVGILFVSPKATYYGKFDEAALAVMPADEGEPGAEDLIDRATVNALMTGAQVVVCEPEQIPGNRELGAIFRY